LATRPLLPQHDGAARIVANDVERVLADIDADHAIAVLSIWDMTCSLSLAPLCQLRLLGGRSNGRTITLADIGGGAALYRAAGELSACLCQATWVDLTDEDHVSVFAEG
jgi:hypothetical protein